MEAIQQILLSLEEASRQQGQQIHNVLEQMINVNTRVQKIEDQVHFNTRLLHDCKESLDDIQEDCQNIDDLKTKTKRNFRVLKSLANRLKLSVDPYVSESDNNFRQRHNSGHHGTRRNPRMCQLSPPHQVNRARVYGTPGTDSDSDHDRVDTVKTDAQHHLIPSGHPKQRSVESILVTEEVPTTVLPMHDVLGDIKSLQAAAQQYQNNFPPPPGGQTAGHSPGLTTTTDAISNPLMSPTQQPGSNTRTKHLSSSLSSNSSGQVGSSMTNFHQSNIPVTPHFQEQPSNSLSNPAVLVSGSDKSTDSINHQLYGDSPPQGQPGMSARLQASNVEPLTMPTIQQTTPTMQQTTPTRSQATPTIQQAAPTMQQATPTTQQATPTTPQATPTTQQATPTYQITLTPQQTTTRTTQNTLLYQRNSQTSPTMSPKVQLMPTTPTVPGLDVALQDDPGVNLVPDVSSVQALITSLELPINEDTHRAIQTAFAGNGGPAMERPRGLYTVLLVDTSSSIADYKKRDIQEFIEKFVDEIEDSAASETLEENVALVTFGGNTGVQQGFTNDFSLIRDAFENLPYSGRSPLATGLGVCLAYMKLSAKELQQNGMDIMPRLVVLTDGLVTEDINFADVNDVEETPVSARARVISIVQAYQSQGYRLSCVAVGTNRDGHIMDDIAAIGGGQLVDLSPGNQRDMEMARIMGRYYLYQTIVAQVKVKMADREGHGDASQYLNAATGNRRFTRRDQEEMLKMLRSHDIVADFDNVAPPPDGDESDNEVLREYNFQDLAHMPTIGSRVKKGPNWNPRDADPSELGTVVAHPSEGIVVVKWDDGTCNRYQYIHNHQEVVPLGHAPQPRLLLPGQEIDVGCWVKRGTHWNRGDEDGQADHGVVIRRHRNKYVTVKWPIGIVENYKCGQDGIYEVEAISNMPPAASAAEGPATLPSPAYTAPGRPAVNDSGLISCWQLRDGLRQWRTLSHQESEKVDNHQINNKAGTISITHKGTQYRFDIQKLKYREQGGQAHGEIQQIHSTADEYATLMLVEDAM